jgi:hypothetical protein
MKTQDVTLSIGRRPIAMRLTEWADGGSALIRVDDDQQTSKREGKTSRVFAPSSMAGPMGPVQRFRPVEG